MLRFNVKIYSSFSLSERIFYVLLFLYFLLSSGEMLNLVIGIYKPKLGHVFAMLVFGWMISERRAWKMDRSIFRAFVWILTSMVFSAFMSKASMRCFGYIGVFIWSFIFYFLLPLQLMQRVELERFFKMYWQTFVMVGLYAAVQVLLSLFGIYDGFAQQRILNIARGQAWLYEPSYYALYMIPYVMYHNGKGLMREKIIYPITSRLKLVGHNLFMVLSTSTGLLISYPILLLTYYMMTIIGHHFREVVQRKLKRAVVVLIVSVSLSAVLMNEIVVHSLFKFFYFGFQDHISFSARWEGIVASFNTFLKHPIVGTGLGGVSTEQFLEQSTYDLKIQTLEEFEMYDPTNCLTEVMASLGIIGIAAFAYLGFVFLRAFQIVMRDPAVQEEEKKNATALFLSLVIMMITLQMNQGLFRPYVWIHSAVVYGYLLNIRKPFSSC